MFKQVTKYFQIKVINLFKRVLMQELQISQSIYTASMLKMGKWKLN